MIYLTAPVFFECLICNGFVYFVYLQAFKPGTDDEALRASEAQPMEIGEQHLTFAKSSHVT